MSGGNWIKMRVALGTDPDVIRIAGLTKLDAFSVVGRLHTLWSWADQHSVDGHALSVTCVTLDDIVRCDGFATAMREVGWLTGEDWDLTLPHFDRHNGESAKKRAAGQKRKQKQRSKLDSEYDEDSEQDESSKPSKSMSRSERDKSETREEKRRSIEGKNERMKAGDQFSKLPALPSELSDEELSDLRFLNLFRTWGLDHREWLESRGADADDVGGAILAHRENGRSHRRLRTYVASCLTSGVGEDWRQRFRQICDRETGDRRNV